MPSPPDVVVGVVGKPFGINGQVYVRPDPDFAEPFAPGSRYRVAPGGPGAAWQELVVAGSRLHSGRRIVAFRGVSDRDAAEALRGALLTVPRASIVLEPDAFWADDLLGREVVGADGRRIGTVSGIAEGTAHDFVIVGLTAGGEALIPAVEEFLDVSAERIVVTPIPGLLEQIGSAPGDPG